MEHGDIAQVAALVGALGVTLVLVPRQPRVVLAGFVLLAVAEAGFAWALVNADDLRVLSDAGGGAMVAVAALAVAALAAVLVRYPGVTPVALLAVAPFRIPVELASEEAFLLLPLYAVIAAAGLAFAYRTLRGADSPAVPLWLAAPAALFVGYTAVSLLWSRDLRAGSIALAFFYFPFSVGFALAARSPLRSWLPRALAVTLVALASAFAVIGVWQAQTRRLFFAPDLEVANAYTTFFRVTSVFKDPSLYGRHLVLAIVILLVAFWFQRTQARLALPVMALLFVGLYFSYSQSSFVALFAVTFGIALVLGDRRLRLVLAGVAVVATLVAGVLAVAAVDDNGSRSATSGRTRLVDVTLDAFQASPVVGVGVGAQPRASLEESGTGSVKRNASHTTPLTVLAELGVVGVALYAIFLTAATRVFWLLWLREQALGLALAAAFAVLGVHSLFYAGFFEDPLTWGTLAVAVCVLAREPIAVTKPGLPGIGRIRRLRPRPRAVGVRAD
jgi:hypothetical protein